jgi:hypothetical protein
VRIKTPLVLVALVATSVLAVGAAPSGKAVKILSPRFFPGWQAQNVFDPFVLLDPRSMKYRMYYSGSATAQINDSVWDLWATGIASSNDGLSWTFPDDYKPVLVPRQFHQGEVLDQDELTRSFDSLAAYSVAAIADGASSKLWYTGWNGDVEALGEGRTRKVHFRIGQATSADGVAWTKQPGDAGAGAVLGLGAPGDPDAKGVAHPSVLKTPSEYRLWYEGYDGETWRIAWAASIDGRAWTKRGVVVTPGGRDSHDELGARRPVVIRRAGRYELWYQGYSRSGSTSQSHVLRAISTDGVVWSKLPGEVALHPEPMVRGDEEIYVHSVLVQSDGRCRVFFTKEETRPRQAAFGQVSNSSLYVFTETVNP